MDCRVIRAFTPVFDGSSPAMTPLVSIRGEVRKFYAALAGGSASTEYSACASLEARSFLATS